VRCLIEEFGADVEQIHDSAFTPLLIGVEFGQLDVVRCLVTEFGVDISRASADGYTPLILAAQRGYLKVVQWLLAEGGASVDEICAPQGHTLWHMLEIEDADNAELTSLFQTMFLLADAPPEFVTRLSHQQAQLSAPLLARGRQLRAQLPSYLEQQRASIIAHCPLPGVLQPLVAEYAAPTPEDMWTDGLRVSVI
jgi:hypothetical protein